jgi:cytoskeleton protein RodZ
MRGVSLDEIAESTKIGTRLLKALEDEQFDLLPGGIFNKGFVRAYAKYLGMDEDQAVADYLQASGNEEPDVQLIAHPSEWPENKFSDSGTPRRGFPLVPVFLLVVIVAVGFGGWRLYQRHQEKVAAQAEPAALQSSVSTTVTEPAPSSSLHSSAPQPSSTPVNTQSTQPQPPPKEAPSLPITSVPAALPTTGFDVAVKTTGRAWVSLKVDGKYLVRGVLEADQVRNLHAEKEIVVWTGNAGATQVSFDGKPIPMEGGVNEPRVLLFKPNGLQPSVRPAAIPPTQPTEQPAPTQQ